MKYPLLLIFLLLLFFTGCNQQANLDRAKLDSILTSQRIDTIEFISPMATNSVTGGELQKLITSLQKTNRISNTDWTKQQVQGVRLLNGTNEICQLLLGEDGAWQFGEYGFRTRE